MFSALWTWFISKFSVKTALVLGGVAILAFAGWHGYNKLYDRIYAEGVASQAKTISKLQTDLKASQAATATAQAKTKTVQGQLDVYVKQYNDYVAQTKAQQDALAKQQAATVTTLNKQIAKLHSQLSTAQTEFTHVLPTLLPSDDSCDMPVGVVLLYNASLTGTDPTGGFTDAFRLPSNANTPSGVSCRAFASVVLDNNLAAYANRQGVLTWQHWYTTNKQAIDKVIDEAKATPTPITPVSTEPNASSPTVKMSSQ